MAADLFGPIQLGPYELPNRIVMAPLTRSRAGNGNVPHTLNALYYAQRERGIDHRRSDADRSRRPGLHFDSGDPF